MPGRAARFGLALLLLALVFTLVWRARAERRAAEHAAEEVAAAPAAPAAERSRAAKRAPAARASPDRRARGSGGSTEWARAAPPESCVVARVSDGDTFRCRDGVAVRLLLIDAPELGQPPHGAAARAALARLVPPGTTVTLETDVRPLDRYGRLLAYGRLPDGRMVNEQMARAGYAVVLSYPPNVRHVERIRRAVDEARRARRGLWADEGFACEPREHRRGRC